MDRRRLCPSGCADRSVPSPYPMCPVVVVSTPEHDLLSLRSTLTHSLRAVMAAHVATDAGSQESDQAHARYAHHGVATDQSRYASHRDSECSLAAGRVVVVLALHVAPGRYPVHQSSLSV